MPLSHTLFLPAKPVGDVLSVYIPAVESRFIAQLGCVVVIVIFLVIVDIGA